MFKVRLNWMMPFVELNAMTLDEAKAEADAMISYTQQDAVIFEIVGCEAREVSRRKWQRVKFDGTEAEMDALGVIDFGNGYYDFWEDAEND